MTKNEKIRKSRILVVRLILAVLSLMLFLLFFPPITGVSNLGSWFGMGFSAVLATVTYTLPAILHFVRSLWQAKHTRLLLIALGTASALFVFWALYLITCMVTHAATPPPPDTSTVLVLGCKVNGETPGKALLNRLEAAHAYLIAHPNAVAILSGGKGEDEAISEAEAMYRYLTEHGIDGNRLIIEDRSTNTEENIAYSVTLLRAHHLDEHVAIVTHSYHQYRAALEAMDFGLVPYAVNAKGDLLSYPTYFLRDLLGVAHKTVFG